MRRDLFDLLVDRTKWCRRCGGKHGAGGCRLKQVGERRDGAKVYRREGIA